ncbi:methylenetetrahydrofolate reductase (NADPH) [Microplitis mediator]|uniref:methylenetetrahydrofolate reductase (NADPH) n=1 Tax=Microplitis mediator TaxID=375433 RepID=UPI002554697E|nr:methylenetetrahydrofolate reductase (NADPH) [Microplitis mediator]
MIRTDKTLTSICKIINYSHMSFKNNLNKLIKEKWDEKKFFYSFELISHDENIHKRFFMDLREYSPLFYALTCHKKLNINNLNDNLSEMDNNFLLHVTARGKNKNDVRKILDRALELGITGVLALRGDERRTGDFPYAVDLVKFIKENYKNKFSVAVAGYPDRHPESVSKETEFFYLKEKVNAGADFIITQIIFDSESFINFVADCKNYDINIPIIAGVLPVINYPSLIKLMSTCKCTLPQSVHAELQKIKDDDSVVQQYGVELIIKIITDIIASGSYGFHFFTLNQSSSVIKILNKLTMY